MADTNDEIMQEMDSLLVLNDDCLMEIFQHMALMDYVNLIDTCPRLRELGNEFSARNFKTIRINVTSQMFDILSPRQLSQILSKIGEYVLEIELCHTDSVIKDIVAAKCTNLKSLKLVTHLEPVVLEGFKKLDKLEIFGGGGVNLDEWKDLFVSNPELEVLHYDCTYGEYQEGFIKLMDNLPKLDRLGLPCIRDSFHQSPDFQDLLSLSGLRKLSLSSWDNLNGILLDLPKNLVELDIRMDFDSESLKLITPFENLEVLCISWVGEFAENEKLLPKTLKCLKICWMNISSSKFLKIVEYLTVLKEFHIESGEILLDENGNFKNSQAIFIQTIENALMSKQRTLKIVLPHFEDEIRYLYRSAHLEIVNQNYMKKGRGHLQVNLQL